MNDEKNYRISFTLPLDKAGWVRVDIEVAPDAITRDKLFVRDIIVHLLERWDDAMGGTL